MTKGFKRGDLVTVSKRVNSVTVWTNISSDDVEGYLFPGDVYVVLGIDQLSESLRVIDTKNGFEGWVSQNVVDKVEQ